VRNHGELVIGSDVIIASEPASTHLVVSNGAFLRIADRVQIGQGGAIACLDNITMDDDVLIGSFVAIMDSDFHVAGDSSAAPTTRPVTIGRGVRIGHRAIVLPGSHIGDGAVVGAGSVVSGSIPPGAHVFGNPASPLRRNGPGTVQVDVRELLARTFFLPALPEPDDGPHNIAGWDSLGALELLMSIESEFNVAIDERELGGVNTVADLDRLVARLQAAN
jgi:acetyltransferase-like isoleucine patch superfamily enzyme/acyl carrier protein